MENKTTTKTEVKEVVKVAKPQQDMRFDVPTIGIGTLESMLAAGAKVLAVEAGKTIIVDEVEVLDSVQTRAQLNSPLFLGGTLTRTGSALVNPGS